MRISVWSSDVFSSDLGRCGCRAARCPSEYGYGRTLLSTYGACSPPCLVIGPCRPLEPRGNRSDRPRSLVRVGSKAPMSKALVDARLATDSRVGPMCAHEAVAGRSEEHTSELQSLK